MGNQTGAAGLGTLGEEIKLVQALSPQVVAAGTVDGAAIDRLGYNVMVLASDCATITDTVDAKIQESDTGIGGWTDAVAGEFGGVASALVAGSSDSAVKLEVDLRGLKRYIRTANLGGAAGGTLGQVAVLSGTDVEPAV